MNRLEDISKQEIEDKLSKLDEIINEMDEPDYLVSSLYRMYKILYEIGQYEDYFNYDNPHMCRRLIKCNRYIPNYILSIHNSETVVLGGLYIVTDMYVFSSESIQKVMKKHKGGILHPEEEGLPPESIVNYGTLQIVDKFSVAQAKSAWLNEYVYKASQYNYVSLRV